jgi:hypothetical protein
VRPATSSRDPIQRRMQQVTAPLITASGPGDRYWHNRTVLQHMPTDTRQRHDIIEGMVQANPCLFV